MIDDTIKNEILSNLPKLFEDWKKQKVFSEPAPRWFRLIKGEHNETKTHYLVCILVGKDV